MATRLERFLSHGSISNTEPGRVTGTLWFIDVDEPVTLDLKGDCHRDLAGGLLVFERPDPELEPGQGMPDIARLQTGTAGDITASKKVYFQESPLGNSDAVQPTLVNGMCIEWYDETGGRFAIDSTEFHLSAGDHEWSMDAETEREQILSNTRRFHAYIDAIANRIEDEDEALGDPGEEQPLDEFEWEERLKESDRITEAYMEALDKYQDLPNQDKLVAAAMGWSQESEADLGIDWNPGDAGDDDQSSVDPFGNLDDFEAEAWISADSSDHEEHPLYQRAREFSTRLHREAQEMGILEPEDDTRDERLSPIQTLVFSSMDLSAKLAGALNGISLHDDPEPGLIVAWLKRGMPIVGRALGAAESAQAQGCASREWIERARRELFDLRTAILDLIQEFRKQLP